MTNPGRRLAAVVTACGLILGQIGAPIVSASESDRDERAALRNHRND